MKDNTISYSFRLFKFGGPCQISRLKQCPGTFTSENRLFTQFCLYYYLINIANKHFESLNFLSNTT